MSEAERLAKQLEDEADFDIHHMAKSAMAHAAAELRRLAAVEQELEALKRAISDAEPYAWHYTNNGGASVLHRWPSNRLDADIAAANEFPRAHHVTPLYTLKGIK